MKREIKFRAWSNQSGVMYNSENVNDNQGEIHTLEQFFQALQIRKDLKYYEFFLMQYTGVIDKNGIGIYEGDLIKSNQTGGIFQVMFGECNEGYVGWYVKSSGGFEWPISSDGNGIKNENIEIVGNIYENQDLCTPS